MRLQHGKLKKMDQLFMYIYKLFFFIFFLIYKTSHADYVDLTVNYDGSNLPKGVGFISEGQEIFMKMCSSCHGLSGEGYTAPELTGGSELLIGKNISLTIGNYWPYAPKIFDYVRRAKKNEKNKNFTNSQVYSLTGYLLKINNLYDNEIIDKEKLSNIEMPNFQGFINNYQEKQFQ